MKTGLGQIAERLGDRWEAFSVREKIMVGSLAGLACALLLGFVVYSAAESVGEREDLLLEHEETLRAIEGAADRYRESEGDRLSGEIRLRRAVPSLKGHIESVAERIEITIENFGPEKELAPKGRPYKEASVEVKFRRVELPKIASFMKTLESDRMYTLAVKRLTVRPDVSDANLLNVEMEIAAYSLVETPGTKKPAGVVAGAEPAGGEDEAAEPGKPAAKPARTGKAGRSRSGPRTLLGFGGSLGGGPASGPADRGRRGIRPRATGRPGAADTRAAGAWRRGRGRAMTDAAGKGKAADPDAEEDPGAKGIE